ncbi:MAG TPA: carboxypeptidase-like regulatory domain-containing protein [Pyrinomonadaceae bacterium]|nr:carboxypeptidase-like regulatory domain-containing protein [Pyrinomonadaceae bacterium]
MRSKSSHTRYPILALVLAISLLITPLLVDANISISKNSRPIGAQVARIVMPIPADSPTPAPGPVQRTYSIAPSSGTQGKEYEVIVTQDGCAEIANATAKLDLHAPTGSGITVEDLNQRQCQVTGRLRIAPDAPLGIVKLWLSQSSNPSASKSLVDFTVTGVSQQPIPPGLNNKGQVDAFWAVVPDKIVRHNFGSAVSKHFYEIEVVIGNDSGYDLQLSGVGFTLPALGGQYRIPSSGYRTVRGSMEGLGEYSARKLTIASLKNLPAVLSAFLPFFHVPNRKANFSTVINLINPFEKGLEDVWPDLLPTRLDRLADQTYRDDVSTKTIIPNNVQARIITFVPKKLVCPEKQMCLPTGDQDEKQKDPNNLKKQAKLNDQDVMRALGQLVIVGQQIEHVNRVRVVSTPFGSSLTDHSISGRITDACNVGVADVTLTLSGGGNFSDRKTTTDADGSYKFSNVPDGRTYTIEPELPGLSFSPSISPAFFLNDTKANLNFSADHLIRGTVTKGGVPLKDVTLELTEIDGTTKTATTNDKGEYQFEVTRSHAAPFKIIPSLDGHTFTPAERSWSCADKAADFVAIPTTSPSPAASPGS